MCNWHFYSGQAKVRVDPSLVHSVRRPEALACIEANCVLHADEQEFTQCINKHSHGISCVLIFISCFSPETYFYESINNNKSSAYMHQNLSNTCSLDLLFKANSLATLAKDQIFVKCSYTCSNIKWFSISCVIADQRNDLTGHVQLASW